MRRSPISSIGFQRADYRRRITWKWLAGLSYTDDRLAAGFIDLLLARRQVQKAVEVWTAHLGARKGDYPDANRLFNAGFEFSPIGAVFDWRISPVGAVEVARDSGTRPRRPLFPGTLPLARLRPNRSADHHPEGIRLRIFDPEAPGRLDVRTDQLTGTHDWTPLQQVVLVPVGTRLVTVQICRDPSPKFDNKIQGAAWVDAVSVLPAR